MSATEHIFVSYARRDTASVDRIVEALRAAGYRVWIDRDGILGARLWRAEIVAAIRGSNAFLIALSPYSVASPNVRKELDLSQQYGKRLVPLLLAETKIPDDMQYQLVGVQHVNCHSLDEGFEELRRALKSLEIEPSNLPADPGAPSKPATPWWRDAPGVLGVTAVLAAAVVYAVASLTQGKTATPSSLVPLMPVSLFDSGSAGLFSLGLCGILAVLGAVLGYSKSLRPTILRFAPFVLLTVPLALWKGQHAAAALGVIAAVAVGVWWHRRPGEPQSGIAQGPLVASALILLGSVVLGVTAQSLLKGDFRGGSTLGVTTLHVDEELEQKQAYLSNMLRQKLSAVFSKADLNVVPQESFNEKTLNGWIFENWSEERIRHTKLRFLLRTLVRECGLIARSPDDRRPPVYTWVAQPYGRDLEPLPGFSLEKVSGTDPEVLSLRIAAKLLPFARKEKRDAARKAIVEEAQLIAGSKNMTAQEKKAALLLGQSEIKDQEIDDLLNSLTTADDACDKAAASNLQALATNATSYGKGGP